MKTIDNPFSTRRVRPGAIPFLYPADIHPQRLISRLVDLNGRGAIVGPHGCGKTTLLLDLAERIERSGRDLQRIMLNADSTDFSRLREEVEGRSRATWIALDGFEQLNRRERNWLVRFTRQQNRGLLVTTHRRSRLPTLLRLSPNAFSFDRVLSHLCQTYDQRNLDLFSEWNRRWPYERKLLLFRQHGGDFREAMFSLYDDWEQFLTMEHIS